MLKSLLGIFIVILVAVVGYATYTHRGMDESNQYVTSQQCRQCHPVQFHSWRKTLHPKMFRPVRDPGDLLGDFDSPSTVRTFERKDVQFVVGNRWEQIYARMIDGEYYPLPAKWHIAQKKWVPYKVKDWKDVKMSYQCNGCHTTGFDAATLKFAEFGIGCEACHGPGEQHVQNEKMADNLWCTGCHPPPATGERRKDIIRTVSSAVCAQCHDRGSNTGGDFEGKFSFPINMVPGDDPSTSFKTVGPSDDKKGKYWWGQGISRARHQEYADWNLSKHAKSLNKVHENSPDSVCPQTGVKEGCLQCHSTDYRLAAPDSKPDLDHVQFGVTCVACHDPHGVEKSMTRGGGTEPCGDCHIQNLARQAAKRGKPHIPCPSNQVLCADCHMPRIIDTAGFFSLRSHAFRIITPIETRDSKMPNSCQNGDCHKDRDADWLVNAYQQHYPAKPE